MNKVKQYAVFEISLESDRDYDNPFADESCQAVFTGPDGTEAMLSGFHDGDRCWKARFVPETQGAWTYTARLETAGIETKGELECVLSDQHGFLVISAQNPYRFEHKDGTPFYPIGQQVGAGVSPAPGFDAPEGAEEWTATDRETFMQAFTGATNLIRSQFGCGIKAGCSMPVNTEETGPDRYDLENSRWIDDSCRAIKQYGWAQIGILFQDMSLHGEYETLFGTVRDTTTYKTMQSPHLPAMEQYIRYAVARWSAYIDIWEIYNEDSYAPDDLLAHFAGIIREADPYRHPITTNYERPEQDWCEIVCPHAYMVCEARQVPAYLSMQFARQKSYGKPVQYTEFGNKVQLSNYDPDKWRLAAWVSFMHESGMLYWNMSGRKTIPNPDSMSNSNAYLGPETRQGLRALQEFSAGLPLSLRPRQIFNVHRTPLEAWALGDGNLTVLYAHNPVDHTKPTKPTMLMIRTGPGDFNIQWTDPATGETVGSQDVSCEQQIMHLDIPSFTIDLAGRIESRPSAGGRKSKV
ncbi:DUF5060 domain-containing protein [Planctomycetota bacterium]